MRDVHEQIGSSRRSAGRPGCHAIRLGFVAFLAFAGCTPPGPATASRPGSGSGGPVHPVLGGESLPGRRARLHDWVLHPRVVAAERDAGPARIVSGAPNVTEICCALGLRGRLVGRTRYCVYPPEIAKVPSIGALNDVNAETLLGLRPDLILVAGTSRMQVERLRALELRFERVPDTRLDDLFVAIGRIGALTGRPRTAARLCVAIRSDLAAVDGEYRERVAGTRVLLVTGTLATPPRPPYVAGPGSFYDDLLKRAGCRNVVGQRQSAFGPLSLEFVIRADPDVIVELDADGTARPAGDADALRAWSRLGRLRAVRHGRVHVLQGPQHFLLGPRIALTYRALCAAIGEHPVSDTEPRRFPLGRRSASQPRETGPR